MGESFTCKSRKTLKEYIRLFEIDLIQFNQIKKH